MINQFYCNWGLRLGLLLNLALITNATAFAQVTADPTLGTQVTENGSSSLIEGGTTVGNTNLFHSFSSFSIPNGGGGIFVNDSSISNIFARVTGGTASNIQGLIRTQGTANLFLMNPNGIIFGQNARLNIGGSFVATTANAIQFPGGAEFSLTSLVAPDNTLLSINPTAFLFNQIANQGVNSIENRSNLQVPNNKSLILLGGGVAPTPESTGQILMDRGLAIASDGRVEIGGLTALGTVGLNVDGDNLSLTFPDGVARADISLENESTIFANGRSGGNIVVNANNISLQNSSNIVTGIFQNQGTRDTKAGSILVNANGVISIENESIIGNFVLGTGDTGNINITAQLLKLNNSSAISAYTNKGNSGDILVNANNINLRNSSQIYTRVDSNSGDTQTKAGDISINARGIFILENLSFISNRSSERGNSGNINITAQSLNIVSSGINISSRDGKTGVIDIKVKDNISLSGENPNLFGGSILNLIYSNDYSLLPSPPFVLGTPTSGSSGDINIQARNILVADDSSINSNNILAAMSGNIKLQADDAIILSDNTTISTANIGGEKAGNLSIVANRLSFQNNAQISSSSISSGSAGNINITVKEFSAENDSSINAFVTNVSAGNGGNISIDAEQVFWNSSDFIFTSANSGDAGNITINTKFLQFTGGGINAATSGKGNGGNVIVNSTDAVIIDNSLITSEVREGAVGKAGDIQINTPRLTLTNGGQIVADISEPNRNLPGGQGEGGSIRIDATDAVIISGKDANGFPSLISVGSDNGTIGQAGDITVNTGYFRLENEGEVRASTKNSSDGGNITINARTFELLNGGQILNSTSSRGNAGNITIDATYSITISGVSADNINAAIFAGTNPNSVGNGGTISLFTNNFNVANSAGVTARSQGQGIAGDIKIIATGNYNANNGFVSARAEQAGGGNINITAKNISLRNNSDTRTDLSTGQASGGNISLNANTIIALEDSDILAFAPEGQGGNITFNTRALLTSPLYRPTQTATDVNSLESLINNNSTDINASGAISGNIIGVPDITFIQNSLTELQSNPIDTNALIANSCIARNPKQEGTFLIIGAGGLPIRPGNASASTYPTGEVQNITNDNVIRQWKKGDLIIEPEGVYRLKNGDLVMSRECR